MAAKIPTPDTVERPAAQKRESLIGQVWSSKLNPGERYIITDEEGRSTGSPILISLFRPQSQPPAFCVTEKQLHRFYKHRPDIDPGQIHPGGLTAETAGVTIG